jgi:hypothetical protein
MFPAIDQSMILNLVVQKVVRNMMLQKELPKRFYAYSATIKQFASGVFLRGYLLRLLVSCTFTLRFYYIS